MSSIWVCVFFLKGSRILKVSSETDVGDWNRGWSSWWAFRSWWDGVWWTAEVRISQEKSRIIYEFTIYDLIEERVMKMKSESEKKKELGWDGDGDFGFEV